ncbi:MAG: hypothetical protein H6861_06940 [Rhodospirillales bacterium]|nr:hypothetical protein [Rhodospirillales bacterium]
MKHVLALTCLTALAIPSVAQAESFLDRIDRAVSKVENTISRTENTIDRTTGTAERLNSKIPEAGGDEPMQEQTANNGVTAEEQRILDQAKKIEEERILREAEKIKSRPNVR